MTPDVVIVGGGPAGLAAAIYLVRFRRRVTVFDAGGARAGLIAKSHNCPGFPDGISGPALMQRLRKQACRYGADIITGCVERVERAGDAFQVATTMGSMRCPRIVLATGVVDIAPDIPMLYQGISTGRVRLCPVCDGYEVIGQKVAVVGPEAKALQEAIFLRDYTPSICILCNRPADVSTEGRSQAAAAGIEIWDTVDDLVADRSGFTAIFGNGESRHLDVIYPAMGSNVRSELAWALGAQRDDEGYVVVDRHQRTTIDGVYAIGDVVKALNQIAVGFGHAALAAADIHNGLRSASGGRE